MRAVRWLGAPIALLAVLLALAGPAGAEQGGSQARAFQAGLLGLGVSHTCAIGADRSVACWGWDLSGQLGDDSTLADQSRPVPVALPAGRSASAIAAGFGHTCAILDDGSAACWGADGFGQLGDDATLAVRATPAPVALPAGRRAVALAASDAGNTCAILDDGTAWCWGDDTSGQLGDDPTIAAKPTPVQVALPAGRRAVAISNGDSHACAILDDASVTCWGGDGSGQLGNGAPLANQPTPVAVQLPAGRRAVALAAGAYHVCVVVDDGGVLCWGSDGFGQLGDGVPEADKAAPVGVTLPAGRRAVAIAAGYSTTCVVLDDGSLACWGDDGAGELGNDAGLTSQEGPVTAALPSGRSAVAIGGGGEHTCALLDDGSLLCWGKDDRGQLGNGPDATTKPVAALSTLALSAHALASRVADASVALEGGPAGLTVGATGTVTVRLTNAGPDTATGLRVQLVPTLLSVTPAVVAQGTVAGGYWEVGSLAPGASTVATLTLGALAAGSGSLMAQVAAQGETDSDSVAANGAAGEDDQASAAVAITAAAVPPPPAPTKVAPEKLTLALSTAKDTTAPHTATATGRLVAGAVADRTACSGKVTVTAKAGRKTLLTRTATLKLKDGACEYTVTLSLTAKQRGTAKVVKVTAAFPGNDALLAAASKARTLKLA